MERRPNILFIISDQHQRNYAGCYGSDWVRTPRLDGLAGQGMRFTRAYCQSPLCGPSRASIMTGQYPHTCRAYTHGAFPLPDGPTLGSVFRRAGYVTGAIGKVHILGETRERDLGFDERAMRIYTHAFADYIGAVGEDAVNRYATYRRPLERFQTVYNPTNRPIDLPDEQMFDHLVVERCVDFMSRHAGEPFLLWAGLEKPHTDWTAPAAWHAMYDPARMALPATVAESRTDLPNAWVASTRQAWCFDESEIQACVAAYAANVSYLDAQVGRLLDALDRLGLADDTVVVYTTDHGEMCFDHGMVQKQNFFESSVHVPMLVRGPGVARAGTACDAPVELLDLFPTFCGLAGVDAPPGLEGRSLAAALEGRAADDSRPVFSEFYDWGFPERMVRRGSWKYMHAEGDVCQLYDLDTDPLETCNRIDDPTCRHRVEDLRAEVQRGWERPDMRGVKHGGPWNAIDNPTAGCLMNEWAAGRRRIVFDTARPARG